MSRTRLKAFSLLETLIASAILITITSAVVALANSTITGTVVNADETVINRWGAEGLEAITKIRDDRVNNNAPYWLAQAEKADKYGWYKMTWESNPAPGFWKLTTTAPIAPNIRDRKSFITDGEPLTSGSLVAYRMICIEAVGAVSKTEDSTADTAIIRCNTKDDGSTLEDDGNRDNPTTCIDRFCTMTKPSLNANNLDKDKNIIPSGNAVKVRVVMVWQDKEKFRAMNLATIFTNWRNNVQ